MSETRQHLEAVYGAQTGWTFIGIGRGGHWNNGKYRHEEWTEHPYRWPDQADEIVTAIAEAAPTGDVYFTPALSENPVRQKAKNPKHARKPRAVATLWADLDDNWTGQRVADLKGRFLVYSGSDTSRRHLYVPLIEPVDPELAEDLLRRLAAHVGGDPAVSWHGAYLRPVGTVNHKAADTSNKVMFAMEPSAPRMSAEDLDRLLPAAPRRAASDVTAEAEPVGELSGKLADLVGEPSKPGTRSERTYAVVAHAIERGYSDGQILTIMRQHKPTTEKYGDRADAQVRTVIGKVRANGETTQLVGDLDGASLLDEVHDQLTRYVAFPSPEAAVAVTLYAAATHAQDAWEHATRLVIKSPVKRCGKTRLQEVLAELCYRVLKTTNISPAALARSIPEDDPPTIMLDEADSVFAKRKGERSEGAEDIRGIINSGHGRGWPYVRWDPAKRVREECPTFAMAILGGIGDMPDTIEDRAVVITMRRRAPGEAVTQFRRRRAVGPLRALRDRLHVWVLSVITELADAEPELPLEDRAADVWEPLVAIADAAGGEWPERARRAAKALTPAEADEDAGGTSLLADIHTVFGGADRLSTANLVERLNAVETSPWGGWRRGEGLDGRALAKLLKPYDVRPDVVRIGEETARGYLAQWFHDAWSRYVPTYERNTRNDRNAPASNVTEVTGVTDGSSEEDETACTDCGGPHHETVTHRCKCAGCLANPGQLDPFEEPF
jgi:hypothetical protein